MSKVSDIEKILDDGRYKVDTKIECIHAIIDEGEGLTFGEWAEIHEIFEDRLWGGIQEQMTIEDAVKELET